LESIERLANRKAPKIIRSATNPYVASKQKNRTARNGIGKSGRTSASEFGKNNHSRNAKRKKEFLAKVLFEVIRKPSKIRSTAF
jgi:hypothetical protein